MSLAKAAIEFLDLFEQNTTHINDKRLVAWVKLQIIAEEVEAVRVKLQESAEKPACHVSNAMNQDLVRTLEDRLGAWRYTSQAVMNGESSQTYCIKKY